MARGEKKRFSENGVYQRGNTWRLDFTHNGKRYYCKLGTNITKTAAKEIAAVKRSAILKGEEGIGRKQKDITFDEATKLYLDWVRTNKRASTAIQYETTMRNLASSFGGKKLSAIHPFLIEKYKQKRVKQDVKVAVNRELACLKAMFYRCIECGKFEGENPVRRVKMLKESRGRLRYLEPEEELRLLEAASEPLRTIIQVGIYSGLRVVSEALTLLWEDIDFERNMITVRAEHAKNGRERRVNMNSVIREALARLEKTSSAPWVFTQENGERLRNIRRRFERACRKAELEGVTPHVLRHTFASRLVMGGVDLRTVQELGGWAQLKMLERYAHLSEQHKADAVEKIAIQFTTDFTTPQKAVGFTSQ